MLLLMLGGALGTYLRYAVGKWFNSQPWAQGFPYGTLFINVTGSFILAAAAMILLERLPPKHQDWYLLIGTGFCGGYTTFSTFEYETARLIEDRDFLHAFFYVTLSFAVGLMAVWGGIFAARWMAQAPLLNSIIETERSTQAISGVPVMDELEMANLNGGRESVEPKDRS